MDVFNQLKQTAKDMTKGKTVSSPNGAIESKVSNNQSRQLVMQQFNQTKANNTNTLNNGKNGSVQHTTNGHHSTNQTVQPIQTNIYDRNKKDNDEDSDIEITEIRYNPNNDMRSSEDPNNLPADGEDHKVSLTSMIQMKMGDVVHQMSSMDAIPATPKNNNVNTD
jgi:hypothetical protein